MEGDAANSLSHSWLRTKASKLSEDVAFVIDHDLMDVYADLTAQMNPDDFLDFDGEFAKRT